MSLNNPREHCFVTRFDTEHVLNSNNGNTDTILDDQVSQIDVYEIASVRSTSEAGVENYSHAYSLVYILIFEKQINKIKIFY